MPSDKILSETIRQTSIWSCHNGNRWAVTSFEKFWLVIGLAMLTGCSGSGSGPSTQNNSDAVENSPIVAADTDITVQVNPASIQPAQPVARPVVNEVIVLSPEPITQEEVTPGTATVGVTFYFRSWIDLSSFSRPELYIDGNSLDRIELTDSYGSGAPFWEGVSEFPVAIGERPRFVDLTLTWFDSYRGIEFPVQQFTERVALYHFNDDLVLELRPGDTSIVSGTDEFDADNDGITNLEEIRANSNPVDHIQVADALLYPIRLVPDYHDFGYSKISNFDHQFFSLTNTTPSEITITNLVPSNTLLVSLLSAQTPACESNLEIDPGDACFLRILFNPQEIGYIRENLEVNYTGIEGSSTLNIPVNGRAVN